MFIIVQNIMQEAHEDIEVFDRFDILTSASGFPIKFNTYLLLLHYKKNTILLLIN